MSQLGLTQAELARQLGVKPPTVAQVLSGRRGRIPGSLLDILGAVGLTLQAVSADTTSKEE